ncbi:hypothetical protein NLI96_g8568 [Meripilus lineatus]|uniref:Uncharacterized protein n=1 Tax=Meripilus lineatus TaxID=2056292 RepID=A0AAD5UX48_9APHY|nr:hypothetical protein NLI96_g8568 [Physisporinus lineatus]
MVSDAIFPALRAWAISGRQKAPLLVALSLGLFVPAANIYNFTLLGPATLDSESETRCLYLHVKRASIACTLDSLSSLRNPNDLLLGPIATRVAAMLEDLLVLLVTWIKTASLRKFARENHIDVSLVNLLIRDGTTYFLSMFAFNIALVVLVVLRVTGIPTTGGTFFISIESALASILTCRFILDLREVDQAKAGGSTPSAVKFAVQLSATVGAPLNQESVWVTNAGADITEENAITNDPLAEINSRFHEASTDRIEDRE